MYQTKQRHLLLKDDVKPSRWKNKQQILPRPTAKQTTNPGCTNTEFSEILWKIFNKSGSLLSRDHCELRPLELRPLCYKESR